MTPDELHTRLQDLCPRPIELQLHERKSTYASARASAKGLQISLHRLFLHSPTPVLQALIRFALRPDKQSRAVIRQMAHLYFTKIAPATFDPQLHDPKGEAIDLQLLYDRTNELYFDNQIKAAIAWSRSIRTRRFRYITFGSYDRTEQSIWINSLLDHPDVPVEFVEFVVYHEMLHVVCLPHLDSRGRMRVHTAEFKQREKQHRYYQFAQEWEKQALTFFKRQKHGRA